MKKEILSKQKANGVKPDVNGWAGGLLSERYLKNLTDGVHEGDIREGEIKLYGKICRLEGMKLIAEKNRLKGIERVYKGTLDQIAKENNL